MTARTYDFLVRALYPLETLSVFVQLATEVFEALKLFLLCLYRLLLCELAIVVDRPRECC